MPRVSVNICCFNGERYVAQAVGSVLAQTLSDFEVVVINDGSKDRTSTIIRSFQDPRIKLYEQENVGLAASRNRALSLSKGDFIALLDQDDLWEPEKLEQQAKLMESKPDVGAVYSDAYIIDEHGNVRGAGRRGRYSRGRVTRALLEGNYIFCPTVMFRRSILEKIDGFRTDLEIGEEYELYLRLSRLCDFDFVDRPLARYRMHTANTSRDLAKHYAEVVTCLSDFAAGEQDLGLREYAMRYVGRNRIKLAAVLIWSNRNSEAAGVLQNSGLGMPGRACGFFLRLLSLAPRWITRLALLPLRLAGIVR